MGYVYLTLVLAACKQPLLHLGPCELIIKDGHVGSDSRMIRMICQQRGGRREENDILELSTNILGKDCSKLFNVHKFPLSQHIQLFII